MVIHITDPEEIKLHEKEKEIYKETFWDPDFINKKIKHLFNIDWNYDFFEFFMLEPNMFIKADWLKLNYSIKNIKAIRMYYKKDKKLLEIPIIELANFAKFLLSWEKSDLPSNYKLSDFFDKKFKQ